MRRSAEEAGAEQGAGFGGVPVPAEEGVEGFKGLGAPIEKEE